MEEQNESGMSNKVSRAVRNSDVHMNEPEVSLPVEWKS